MGLIECASGASAWRGYEYYKDNRVNKLKPKAEGSYNALVNGSANEPYEVYLDVKHPRKSTCNCPHAFGKQIICKHIVASYFTVFPDKAQEYYDECLKAEEDAMEYERKLRSMVEDYVYKMKKQDLQATLLDMLLYGPEWQFNNFVRDNHLNWY